MLDRFLHGCIETLIDKVDFGLGAITHEWRGESITSIIAQFATMQGFQSVLLRQFQDLRGFLA